MTLLAQAPALPLHKAGPFVAAAYIVFVAVILVYVAIMALRLARNSRELAELRRELLARETAESEDAAPAARAADIDDAIAEPEAVRGR
jgi:hypothetical protein